jgi:hypothetical protein
MTRLEEIIRSAYTSFNARDIDGALAIMHPDVDWTNGFEGGRVRGHEAVRTYWTRQWREIDPRVEPVSVSVAADGRVVVRAHQVVRDPAGAILSERQVTHVYEFDGELVRRMDIEP